MNSVDGGRRSKHEIGQLQTELESLLSRLAAIDGLAPQSRDKLAALLIGFGGYLEGCGVCALKEVQPQHVVGFAAAPPSREPGSRPAIATMHLRRFAIRLLFRLAREAEMPVGDPSLDVDLPPRSALGHRPLTDAEVLLCRGTSVHTLTETRLPAAWALAESSARTSEIPHVRLSDLDLRARRVWLHGGSRTEPRWADLGGWAFAQLERRIRALSLVIDQDPSFVYEGTRGGASAQASACMALAWTLRRSGLAGEPGVRPASVPAWAGRRMFDEGSPLAEVASRLGMRSLDRTAAFIGLEWRPQKGGPR